MAKTLNTNLLIDKLIEETETSIKTVSEKFTHLTEEQFNYKIAPEKWSIAECFEHINIANKHYHNLFREKINTYPKNTQKESFKSGKMGAYFTKMLKPVNDEIKKPIKTIKKFKPATDLKKASAINGAETVSYFLKEQKELLTLLEESKKVDLEKVRIKSALGSWLLFKLGDAFMFIIGHTQRHIIQAENVLKEL